MQEQKANEKAEERRKSNMRVAHFEEQSEIFEILTEVTGLQTEKVRAYYKVFEKHGIVTKANLFILTQDELKKITS